MSIDYEKVKQTLMVGVNNLGDKGVWPPRNGTNSAIYGASLAEEILGITERLDQKELSAIKSPTLIWKLYVTCLNGMRASNWPSEKIKKITDCLLQLMPRLKEDDYYYENSTNKLKNFKLDPHGEILDATEARKLKALLWMHQEAIYYNLHNIGLEVHGPYEKNKKYYLVHDYCNFNPAFWQKEQVMLQNMKIISEFNEINIKFDAFGNYYGDGISNPNKILIMPETIPKEKLERSMSDVLSVTSKFSLKELFDKEIQIAWYSLKPWKDKLGEIWLPPQIDYSQKKASSFKITDFNEFLSI